MTQKIESGGHLIFQSLKAQNSKLKGSKLKSNPESQNSKLKTSIPKTLNFQNSEFQILKISTSFDLKISKIPNPISEGCPETIIYTLDISYIYDCLKMTHCFAQLKRGRINLPSF